MSNDGCTTTLWQFKPGDVEYFIATQHLLLSLYEQWTLNRKEKTTESRYILIPFVSAHKVPPNQIGLAFFFASANSSAREPKNKLVNSMWKKKTIQWFNTCSRVSNWTKSNDDDAEDYGMSDDSTQAHSVCRCCCVSSAGEHFISPKSYHWELTCAEHANAIFYL